MEVQDIRMSQKRFDQVLCLGRMPTEERLRQVDNLGVGATLLVGHGMGWVPRRSLAPSLGSHEKPERAINLAPSAPRPPLLPADAECSGRHACP